jgi:hypothetical protein
VAFYYKGFSLVPGYFMCGLWWVAWHSEMFFSKHLRSLLPVITVAMLYADLSFEAGIVGPFEAIVRSLP